MAAWGSTVLLAAKTTHHHHYHLLLFLTDTEYCANSTEHTAVDGASSAEKAEKKRERDAVGVDSAVRCSALAINRSPQIGLSIDQPLPVQPPLPSSSLSIRQLVPPERERVAIYKLNSVKLNYFICRQRVIDGDGSSDGGGSDGLMTWCSSWLPLE